MLAATPEQIIAQTRIWLEKAVIGLNLCPFAKAVHAKGQVRYRYSDAETPDMLLEHLAAELSLLAAIPAKETDTTLLIHPHVLEDFLDYNDFLDVADAAIDDLGLDGVIQIASFHPAYRFAGTSKDDVTNYTNRSPFPVLQLLREDSISRVVADFPDPESIYRDNMQKLEQLGMDGWTSLWRS